MLTAQNNLSSELAEAVELVEKLKKLSPMEQNFIKGYIQGRLDTQTESEQKQTA